MVLSGSADSKEQLLGVLGEKPRPCLEILRLAKSSRFDCNRGSDGIAIARLTSQTECYGTAESFIALCNIRNCGALRFLRITSSRPS